MVKILFPLQRNLHGNDLCSSGSAIHVILPIQFSFKSQERKIVLTPCGKERGVIVLPSCFCIPLGIENDRVCYNSLDSKSEHAFLTPLIESIPRPRSVCLIALPKRSSDLHQLMSTIYRHGKSRCPMFPLVITSTILQTGEEHHPLNCHQRSF